jgi:hypothetical protein
LKFRFIAIKDAHVHDGDSAKETVPAAPAEKPVTGDNSEVPHQ